MAERRAARETLFEQRTMLTKKRAIALIYSGPNFLICLSVFQAFSLHILLTILPSTYNLQIQLL